MMSNFESSRSLKSLASNHVEIERKSVTEPSVWELLQKSKPTTGYPYTYLYIIIHPKTDWLIILETNVEGGGWCRPSRLSSPKNHDFRGPQAETSRTGRLTDKQKRSKVKRRHMGLYKRMGIHGGNTRWYVGTFTDKGKKLLHQTVPVVIWFMWVFTFIFVEYCY